MEQYTFIKNYKHYDQYRKSFNELAKATFGIDFEEWYQQGFWNEHYICYSYVHNEEVISNVSLSTMELVINGQVHKAIQIGTVMTKETHRRKGLAYSLMQKIFEDYDGQYDLYFLAADDEAVPLYAKCGFIKNPENKYWIDVKQHSSSVQHLQTKKFELHNLLKLKKASLPFSAVLGAIHDEHIFMFYCVAGFSSYIYEMEENIYVVCKVENEELHLYGVLCEKNVHMNIIMERLSLLPIQRIVLYFTPSPHLKNVQSCIDITSNWMIRAKGTHTFPPLARFPKLGQT